MKSKVGIALSWIVVFFLGGIAGAVSHYIYQQRLKPQAIRPMTPPKPDAIIDGMARELNMDDQQKEQLKSIFEQSRQRYWGIRQQYRILRKETNEQIKQILHPAQKAKFEEFLKKVYTLPGRRPLQSASPMQK